jgi:CheY-like chemotaxis protein
MTDGAGRRDDGASDRLRVLVVDDNALLGTSLARLLAQSGYEARATTTVAEALEAAEGQQFDCGIFDIRLGADDGLTLAERLLAEGRVRVAVFFSATLLRTDRRRASRLGVLVSKATSVERVLGVVANLATNRRKG